MDQAQDSAPNEPAGSPRRWVLRVVSFVVLALIILVVTEFSRRTGRPAQAAASQPVPVVVEIARKGDMPIYLTGLGSVTALNTVTVRTRVDGELLNFAVHEGQMVAAGDLLAEIDPRPFQVQLLQAQGQIERDQAILANARIDLERYRVLYAQDSIPKQLFDTQVATVNQSEATVKSDQGAVESAKLQLTYTRITSPITGRIGLRQVDPGNIIHATDQNGLAVITQLQPIGVIFNIAEDHLPPVVKKLEAGRRLPVNAFDRDSRNRISSGTLLTIDNQVDPTTGTVRFKAVFPNRANELFPNQFVNARLLLDTRRGTVLIPAGAVQRGPQASFVFVVNADETVEARNVTVGPIENDVASIDRGLNAGEAVVTQGTDKLQPGMKVAVRRGNAAGEPSGLNP